MIEIDNINFSFDILIKNLPVIKNKKKTDNNIISQFLKMENDTFMIYTIENPIEWTPTKLCQYVYILLKTNNNFWIVKYSKFEGFEYSYIMNLKELLIGNINCYIDYNMTAPLYLINIYINRIKYNDNGYYYYLCTNYDNNGTYYNNYIMKLNDKIHYIQLIF